MALEEKCCEGDGEVVVEESMHAGRIDPNSLQDFCRFFKALGDEKRLLIVSMIAKEPGLCSCIILKELGISQPTLSHHMRVLTTSGVVNGYRQGKWMHYTLCEESLDLVLDYLEEFADSVDSGSTQQAASA